MGQVGDVSRKKTKTCRVEDGVECVTATSSDITPRVHNDEDGGTNGNGNGNMKKKSCRYFSVRNMVQAAMRRMKLNRGMDEPTFSWSPLVDHYFLLPSILRAPKNNEAREHKMEMMKAAAESNIPKLPPSIELSNVDPDRLINIEDSSGLVLD